MDTQHSTEPIDTEHLKPMGMAGAGPLTSAIWKTGDHHSGWRYAFNLYRLNGQDGHVSQLFEPSDLWHIIKLTQVVASVLADDGCLTSSDRILIKHIASVLDNITIEPGSDAPDGDATGEFTTSDNTASTEGNE